MSSPEHHPSDELLAQYGLAQARLAHITTGHINRSFQVDARDGTRFVLQWVNPIFADSVHGDIDAVTRWLDVRGVLTTRLVRTRDGQLFVHQDEGSWRLLSWVEGETREFVRSPGEARVAGSVLGTFHAALADFDQPFAHQRGNVHELPRHVAALRLALTEHAAHPRYAAIRPLADEILELAASEPPLADLPERVVHGDPKLTNILFTTGGERGGCLIDLDTLSRMPLPVELGDAFRSWCNEVGEDDPRAAFSPELFAAALEGYASAVGGLLSTAEVGAIVSSIRRIAVELAARFCRDALDESYFGYDANRFASRGEHNEARASAQLLLARSVIAKADALDALVRNAWR